MRRVVLLVLALLSCGCDDLVNRALGYGYFNRTFIGSGGPSATLVTLSGGKLAIISDCPQEEVPERSPRRVSGICVGEDGRRAAWSCETKDKRSFSRIVVAGKEFYVKDGNSILVSTKGGEIRLLQTTTDHSGQISFESLLQENEDARKFFTK